MPKFDKKTTSKKAVTAYSPFTMKGSPMQRNFFNKLGGMAKKAVMGKDGKFGIGDVARMGMGPIGFLGGSMLTYKDKSPTQKRGCKKK